MLALLATITGLAGPFASVATVLGNLVLEYHKAETDTEKALIQSRIVEVEARKAVLVAEAGTRVGAFINASMRAVLTIGPAAYLTKILLWDKVIGSFVGCSGVTAPGTCMTFNTDPIDANAWWVIFAAIAFYFVYDIATKRK